MKIEMQTMKIKVLRLGLVVLLPAASLVAFTGCDQAAKNETAPFATNAVNAVPPAPTPPPAPAPPKP